MNHKILFQAQNFWISVSDAFRDELERNPTASEMSELLTYVINTRNACERLGVTGAEIKTTLRTEDKRTDIEDTSIDDLNDSTFVIAVQAFHDLIDVLEEEGRAPFISEVCSALSRALHNMEQSVLLEHDLQATSEIEWRYAMPKKRKRGNIGDVIAIPAKDGRFHIAILLGRNRFGTALGILRGTHNVDWAPESVAQLETLHYPVYTDDMQIESGRWKIVGHSKELRSLFPNEPEIYHAPIKMKGVPQVGPYGAGETAEGVLRPLSKEEADRVGLFSGRYRQVHLSESLEGFLDASS